MICYLPALQVAHRRLLEFSQAEVPLTAVAAGNCASIWESRNDDKLYMQLDVAHPEVPQLQRSAP